MNASIKRIDLVVLPIILLLALPATAFARCYYSDGMCQIVKVEFVSCSFNEALTQQLRRTYVGETIKNDYIEQTLDMRRFPFRLDLTARITDIEETRCSYEERPPITAHPFQPTSYGIKKFSLKATAADTCPKNGEHGRLYLNLTCCDSQDEFECGYYAVAQILDKSKNAAQ